MSTTILTMPTSVATLALEIPKLTAANWMEFKAGMEMLFLGAGADYLLDPSPGATIPPSCVKLDKQLVFYIWARVDDELRYLVQDARSSALAVWLSLLSHFQRSTMPRRIAAREQLYSVVHDPSKSIDVFIHAVTSAAKVLADLGCKVEETEIKDILLMKLDTSYASVRTSIMTAKEEPDLATIKSLLSSASSSIPVVPTPFAAAHQVATTPASRPRHRPSYSPPLPVGAGQPSLPPADDQGFQWCNPSNQGACHRCGRANHIAAFCLFSMPQHVKDWVMQGGYKSHAASMVSAQSAQDFEYEPVLYPGWDPGIGISEGAG
jgi:hypothetical protein